MCVCVQVCVIVPFSLAAGAATPGRVEREKRRARRGEYKGGGCRYSMAHVYAPFIGHLLKNTHKQTNTHTPNYTERGNNITSQPK